MYRIIGADGKEYGPVTLEQVQLWIREGRANAETRVLSDGASEWRPLGTLPEFAGPAPATPGSFANAPQPFLPAATQRRAHPLATAGLILGILSLTIGFCCCYGIPMNLIGLIFSVIAWTQIRNQPEIYNGTGVAIAGTILNAISLLLAAGLTVAFGLGALMDGIRSNQF